MACDFIMYRYTKSAVFLHDEPCFLALDACTAWHGPSVLVYCVGTRDFRPSSSSVESGAAPKNAPLREKPLHGQACLRLHFSSHLAAVPWIAIGAGVCRAGLRSRYQDSSVDSGRGSSWRDERDLPLWAEGGSPQESQKPSSPHADSRHG